MNYALTDFWVKNMNGSTGKCRKIEGGAGAPKGFFSAGVHCGIKAEKKLDLALVFSENPARAAAAFTENRIQAAPVKLTRRNLAGGRCQAVIINSGSANACTGDRGERDSSAMSRAAAAALGIDPELIAVCSTGRIGSFLPLERIKSGIDELATIIRQGGNGEAAKAIMTTDSRAKESAVEFKLGETALRLGGMAKGAGMIYPRLRVNGLNQATMLAFITSDAEVETGLLREMLSRSLEQSFNRITVDGDTSTNDTVILLANGSSGKNIGADDPNRPLFQEALDRVTRELATLIVADGEGASKFIEIEVRGARTAEEARAAAAAVANSSLFKTAVYGENPNWGRIMAALGYSGVEVREENINIYLADIPIIKGGLIADSDPDSVRKRLTENRLHFIIDLGQGEAGERYYTCDLTPDYVQINKL